MGTAAMRIALRKANIQFVVDVRTVPRSRTINRPERLDPIFSIMNLMSPQLSPNLESLNLFDAVFLDPLFAAVVLLRQELARHRELN